MARLALSPHSWYSAQALVPGAGRRRQCGRGRSYLFGEPRHRVGGERDGDRAVQRVTRQALSLWVSPRRGWRHLLVAAAAALLVLLMATACAIGGGRDQRATAAQTSTGTSRTLVRAGGRTALELTFRPSAGNGLVARFSLRCDRDLPSRLGAGLPVPHRRVRPHGRGDDRRKPG
jgi:hypothetical protein